MWGFGPVWATPPLLEVEFLVSHKIWHSVILLGVLSILNFPYDFSFNKDQ